MRNVGCKGSLQRPPEANKQLIACLGRPLQGECAFARDFVRKVRVGHLGCVLASKLAGAQPVAAGPRLGVFLTLSHVRC